MSQKRKYVEIDGNDNIILRDIKGRPININDEFAVRKTLAESKPKYLEELADQMDRQYVEELKKVNEEQAGKIVKLVAEELKKRNKETTITNNTIKKKTVNGDLHKPGYDNNSDPKDKNEKAQFEKHTSFNHQFASILKEIYQKRLKQKLDNRLEVNLEYQYSQIGFKDDEVKYLHYDEGMQNEEEAGSYLAKIFNKHDYMVIIGEPGSGKTSRLLDMAIGLLYQAENDPLTPLPVVLNLAPWANNDSFGDWVARAMESYYRYPKKSVEKALAGNDLVLFLDGFDEIGQNLDQEERQMLRKRTLKAIEKYISKVNIKKLVLCSRINEYEEAISEEWKLKIDAQILIKPLSTDKIEKTLEDNAKGKHKKEVRKLLKYFTNNQEIKTVIATPFYFNALMAMLADMDYDEIEFPDSSEAIKNYITEKYIESRLNKTSKNKYTKTKTRKYLAWLANWLKNRQNVIFELSDFGANSLHKPVVFKVIYCIVYGLVSGIAFGLVIGFIKGVVKGLVFGLILGLVLGVIKGSNKKNDERLPTNDQLKWDFSNLKKINIWIKILIITLGFALYFAFIFGFVGVLVGVLVEGLVENLVFGSIFGSIFGLVSGLLGGVQVCVSEIVHFSHLKKPFQRLLASWIRNAILYIGFAIISIFLYHLFYPPSSWQVSLQSLSFQLFIIFLISFFYTPMFKYLIINWLLFRQGSLPFLIPSFFRFCVDINILEQDGGHWRFRHQIIHDYFIKQYERNDKKIK